MAERENITIAATRDLHPQLMSGTLRVKDAERASSPRSPDPRAAHRELRPTGFSCQGGPT
ncbi:hypothetical protein NKG05_22940 [Oerskovia sp. M15]